MRYAVCFLFLLIIPLNFHAQKIDPDDSFTFELCLPNAFANKPYKTIMQGLVSASPYYQYSLKNGISFGAGVHYSYFAINEFRMPVKVFGGIHTGAAFLKLGHEKFWTERFGTDIGCKFGYLQSFGYPFYGYSFAPWTIGYDSDLGYAAEEFSRVSSFLNVGFAYTFYFNGKKSVAED